MSYRTTTPSLALFAALAFITAGRAGACTVNNTGDDANTPNTLRYCAAHAQIFDVIDFDPSLNGQTITLLSELNLNADNPIYGPGASLLTITMQAPTANSVIAVSGLVDISGITFANSTSRQYVIDGAIMLQGANLTLSNCVFSGNQPGIATIHYNGIGSAVVNNSSFSGNSGGQVVFSNDIITVSNSRFSDNTATVLSGTMISVSGSTFSGNVGASILLTQHGNPLTVTNSTFSNNTVTALIALTALINGHTGNLTVNDSTFSGDSGGFINNLDATVNNSIFSGNGYGCVNSNGCPVNGFNGNVVTANAMLAPLGSYGGPTPTMLPLPGSPVICAGSPSLVPSGNTADQRGFARTNTSYTGYSSSNPCVDAGAVQTNYQSVQFTNVPAGGYYTATINQAASPAPVVSVTESSQNTGGIPVALAFTGNGNATGVGPVTTVANAGATFGSLSANATGSSDLLSVTLPVVGAYSLSANAGLKVTAVAQTITVTQSAAAFAVYGSTFPVAATASSTLPVSITASGGCSVASGGSGSATIQMTSGIVNCTVKFDQAGNSTFAPAPQATNGTIAQPAILAATPDNKSRAFGAANPPFTWSYSGFQFSDTSSVVTGTATLTTTATPASVPGQYPITFATFTLAAVNYAVVAASQTGTLTITFTAAVPASTTACNGAYSGTFSGNLKVSAGQTCVFVNGGVTGNVQLDGGALTLAESNIGGNLQISNNATFTIGPGTIVNGNLQVQNLNSGLAPGQICGTTVHNDLQFHNNDTGATIGSPSSSPACAGNTVGGNLQVFNNSGATTVDGNIATGNLDDHNNTGPTQVFNNIVGSNLTCQQNTSITGGGNMAKSKSGQCAAF